jgi:hypothetical protein
MENQTATIASLAAEVLANMETKTRDNGADFVCLKSHDESFQWQIDLCREAHDSGERMPDDGIYKVIEEALNRFAEQDADSTEDAYSDLVHEIADDVDVYTSELTGWLHSHAGNVEYMTRVLEEWGDIKDGFKLLAMAQYYFRQEIAESVLASLQARLESLQE